MLIEQQLTSFGLSDKESRTYLTLLELGTAAVSDVSKKSKINRSTSYVLLESLAKRGLVSISTRGKTRLYNPAPPERLVQLIEERVKTTTEMLGQARAVLPELKSIYTGIGPKPKVSFFEGAEGIRSVYEDTLTSPETILAYASIENMHEALPDYFPDYYRRRAKRGIHIQSIFPDTPAARERVKHDRQEDRTAVLVPTSDYAFSPEINIYDNKVVFMSLREKFGLIIESEELASAMKKIFALSWKEAKRLNDELKKKK